MAIKVVTIARTLGAGGEHIGEELASSLGFSYVDSEIIDRAASIAKVTPAEVAKVEARKGLLDRILDSMATANMAGMAVGTGLSDAQAISMLSPGYEQLIVDVIRETADRGSVVIVAHGAGIPLAGRDDCLRILVTASEATRIKRVAATDNIDEKKAAKAVSDSDKGRADFMRRFYGLTNEGPTNYDLVVNTDYLSVKSAAEGIIATAAAMKK